MFKYRDLPEPDGLTEEQIAHSCGISEALKSKANVEIEVENALLRRALGYTYCETTRELRKDAEGELALVVTKIVEKEVMPCTTAQRYWLQNRSPDRWRDKQAEHNAQDEEVSIVDDLSV